MKQQVKLLALVSALALAGAVPVLGQPVFSFDEFGNGAFGPGTLQPDPTGGVPAWNVLVYNLPFAGVQGDVIMHDGTLTGPLSDVVRFDGQGHLIFYSENNGGFDSPADTPSAPNPLYANQVNIVEQGIEEVNAWSDYIPIPGQPGFDPVLPAGSTYLLISDIPEPSSVAVLLAGLGLLGFRRVGQTRAS